MPRRAAQRRPVEAPITAAAGIQFTMPPPTPDAMQEPGSWSVTRHGAKIVVAANGSLVYLTAREAVRMAATLLANAEGAMQDAEVRSGFVPVVGR